ncbi:iron-containing alcohol dehydrogenase family protein [Clostridium sp. D2Q-11]|uniref:Iron-containing alcohol dehydrogenase family protein n=1 Tax=Anaeromonas frigoriresistens TaxID=2683708 RepID=A0A942UTV3_9FIRM|nr:iron-containing alcohol dehydrogenase family protein [Anaeromonas frigoriresistens]MBS4537885.1 iron-containing alcohol dehydrogenase family protein [Anaeromonas frigoriresistens]
MVNRTHRINIPSILESGPDSIERTGYLLNREGLNNIAVFYDKKIKEMFGKNIERILNRENIKFDTYIIKNNDYSDISNRAFSLPNNIEAIIGMGGGRVIDVSKYIAFLRKLSFISIPTSTSNDGFSSPVASLFIQGKRTTVPAKVPYGIIVDTNIIKGAPDYFIYSGVGDIVSNITALWDWNFEEMSGKGCVEDFALMISKKSINSLLNIHFKSVKDTSFIQNLVDSLIMNGIAMEISGSSAPSSGSEHLISHALDKIVDEPYLHGIQVGIATYIMSKIQDNKTNDINNLLHTTGFWKYTESLKIKKSDFIKAIDLAPSIKPQRHIAIHLEENRKLAKEIVISDDLLKGILI